MSSGEDDIVEDYGSSLEDLTFNSKPLINVLTMLAEENIAYDEVIVKTIKGRIEKVNPLMKMASLYLLDSILKNVGKNYRVSIAKYIHDIFLHVFKEGDEKIKISLFKLRHTWTQFFTPKLLYDLDAKVHELDPNWPVPPQPPPSPTIHVNPKFLKQPEDTRKPVVGDPRKAALQTQEERLREEEHRIQEQLRKLQDEKEKIEKRRQAESKHKNSVHRVTQQEEREQLEVKQKVEPVRAKEEEEDDGPVTHEKTVDDGKTRVNMKEAQPSLTITAEKESTRPLDPRLARNMTTVASTATVKTEPANASKEKRNISEKANNQTVGIKMENEKLQISVAPSTGRIVRGISDNDREKKVDTEKTTVSSKLSAPAQRRSDDEKNRRPMDTTMVSKNWHQTDPRRDPRQRGFAGAARGGARGNFQSEVPRNVTREGESTKNIRDPRRMFGRYPRLERKGPVGSAGLPSGEQKELMVRDPRKDPRLRRREDFVKERLAERQQERQDVKREDSGRDGTPARIHSKDERTLRDHGPARFPRPEDKICRGPDWFKEKENEDRRDGRMFKQVSDGPPFKRPRGREDIKQGGFIGEHNQDMDVDEGENRFANQENDRQRLSRRRLSGPERRLMKMRSREERRRIIPKEKELPPELRMEHHKNLMEQIEIRLKSGELSEVEHDALVAQLELMYRMQRSRHKVNEIETKAKRLKEQRERTQMQQLANKIEHQRRTFGRGLMEAPSEPSISDFMPMEGIAGDENDIAQEQRREMTPLDFHPRFDDERFHRQRPFPDRPHPQERSFHPPPDPDFPPQDPNFQPPDPNFPPPDDEWRFHQRRFPPDRQFAPPRQFVEPKPEFHVNDNWRARFSPPRYHSPSRDDLKTDMERWRSSLEDEASPFHDEPSIHRPEPRTVPVHDMEWEGQHPAAANLYGVGRSQLGGAFFEPNRPPESFRDWERTGEGPPGVPYSDVNVMTSRSTGQLPAAPQSDIALERIERPESGYMPSRNVPASVIDTGNKLEESNVTPSTTEQTPESGQGNPSTSFVGVTELFKNLVNAGIITLHKEADTSRTETPPPELPTEEEKIPEIKISIDSLRKRHASVINSLYRGTQCASCGLRFPEEAKEEYGEHLDWHFKQNKRLKDNSKASSRAWYPTRENWVSFDGEVDVEEQAPTSVFEKDVTKFEKDNDEEITCSVEHLEDDDICDICCEVFEQFWDEELEEWRYKGAIRIDLRTYHYHCYKDTGPMELESGDENGDQAEILQPSQTFSIDNAEMMTTQESEASTVSHEKQSLPEDEGYQSQVGISSVDMPSQELSRSPSRCSAAGVGSDNAIIEDRTDSSTVKIVEAIVNDVISESVEKENKKQEESAR